MKSGLIILVAIMLANLVACSSSSSDLRYLDSRVSPGLEIPPDLTTDSTNSDFELPAVFFSESDDPDSRKKIPVLAIVEALKIEGFADFYWLSLDAPVDELYQSIREFWASEGFTLALDEPVIGIMETEWVFNKEGRQEGGKGFFASLFSSKELSTRQDQFRTRISRDGPEQGLRIYISHRSTEFIYKLTTQQIGEYSSPQWIISQSETELEVEMLSRLMIYLGLQRAQVEQQLENVKLFAPRASFHTDYGENESYLLVQEGYSRTWYRTLHQLERMKFEVVRASFKSGFSDDGMIRVNTNVDIEVEDTGFLSLFSTKTKMVKKQIVLVLSEESHKSTRISIENIDGEAETSPEGIQFLSLLYEHLK